MVLSKAWIKKSDFVGVPSKENFELREEEVSEDLGDGCLLCEGVFWTVDPYMRTNELGITTGEPMKGGQVAKVIASKNKDFPVGCLVSGNLGWKTVSKVDPTSNPIIKVEFPGGLSPSLALGALGMPGATAYFGFLELCNPKEGEVVLVNGAAGAVGSLVGQIAKIKGCKVIAYAGSDAKCKWLKEELKFDHVFNYKNVDLDKTLKEAAPDGIDCYFDNVGGSFTSCALKHMRKFGRVSICGSISVYNATEEVTGPLPFLTILGKQLKIEGFIVLRWLPRWPEAFRQMGQWILEGKLKVKETKTQGFKNMPETFIGLFKGENIGKAIVFA